MIELLTFLNNFGDDWIPADSVRLPTTQRNGFSLSSQSPDRCPTSSDTQSELNQPSGGSRFM
jgi:hypothetical protein